MQEKKFQTLVFCPICDYPVIIKVQLNPCKHIICYSCYCKSPHECAM